MIHIKDCKDGWLYIIKARNASLGIYDQDLAEFRISRSKFGDNYVFSEIHLEASKDFGTAVPLLAIEVAPVFASDQEILDYLNRRTRELAPQIEDLTGSVPLVR